ncbi:MAG: hypothetical protein ABR927_12620 [Bacteroidales bacterium]|jgi:hypothetical protein
MKKICLTITIAVLLLFCLNGLQAQTTQTKLNQVELMKQLIGTWQSEAFQDTIWTGEIKSYGNGLEWSVKIELNGKIIREGKAFTGYDKKNDKLIQCDLYKDSPNIVLNLIWFTSANKYQEVSFEDSSNPGKASFVSKFELKSPDLVIENDFLNDKLINTYTAHRIKK